MLNQSPRERSWVLSSNSELQSAVFHYIHDARAQAWNTHHHASRQPRRNHRTTEDQQRTDRLRLGGWVGGQVGLWVGGRGVKLCLIVTPTDVPLFKHYDY